MFKQVQKPVSTSPPPAKRSRPGSAEIKPADTTAQIQKKGILKNAVAMPLLRLSPINIESYNKAKADEQAVKDTPASPTPEPSSKKPEAPKVVPVVEESPASPTEDKRPKSPPKDMKSESASAESVKPKAKKIVDIAEVLRRGKERAAEKAAEEAEKKKEQPDKSAEAAKQPKPVEPEKPKSPQEPEEPESPTKHVADITSPPVSKGPKVIPLIPLSPTHASNDGPKSAGGGPVSIPLSPTSGEKVIPLSPTTKASDEGPASPAQETPKRGTQTPDKGGPASPNQDTPGKAGPASPAMESVGSFGRGPVAIPLSPTSMRAQESSEDSKAQTSSAVPVTVLQKPADIPAFMNASTDDDSDGEPGLSIAEDLTTPQRDKLQSNPPTAEVVAVRVALDFKTSGGEEEIKVKPISPTVSATKEPIKAPTTEENDVPSKEPKPISGPAPSFAPVFGVLSNPFSFDSFVANPLGATTKPTVSRQDTESPDSDKDAELEQSMRSDSETSKSESIEQSRDQSSKEEVSLEFPKSTPPIKDLSKPLHIETQSHSDEVTIEFFSPEGVTKSSTTTLLKPVSVDKSEVKSAPGDKPLMDSDADIADQSGYSMLKQESSGPSGGAVSQESSIAEKNAVSNDNEKTVQNASEAGVKNTDAGQKVEVMLKDFQAEGDADDVDISTAVKAGNKNDPDKGGLPTVPTFTEIADTQTESSVSQGNSTVLTSQTSGYESVDVETLSQTQSDEVTDLGSAGKSDEPGNPATSDVDSGSSDDQLVKEISNRQPEQLTQNIGKLSP